MLLNRENKNIACFALQVTSLIGTSLSNADLCKFMNEADKVELTQCSQFFGFDRKLFGQILIFLQDGNGKIDYEEFVDMMKQY